MPESIPASLVVDTLRDLFVKERRGAPRQPLGWVLSVPDTHQKTVLAALDKEPDKQRGIRVLTCATEDEANAIAAGLYIGGEPYILMIQHAGLYASVNTLRGVAIDGRVPTLYLIGLLGREKDKDPRESRHSPSPTPGWRGPTTCTSFPSTTGWPTSGTGRPRSWSAWRPASAGPINFA
jgi:hypothetical protein